MNATQWAIPHNVIRQSEFIASALPVQSNFWATVTQYNQNNMLRQGTATASNLAMAALGLPDASTTACGPAFKSF